MTSLLQQDSSLSKEDCQFVCTVVQEACEPFAPCFPIKSFVARNPIHGLEHLPFDQAIQTAKKLWGGNGYLCHDDYRQFYRKGRIHHDDLLKAIKKCGPSTPTVSTIQIGSRHLTVWDLWNLHLIFGFDPLEPALLQWELSPAGTSKRFREDLPSESRQRIIDQTIRDCERCRHDPEGIYLSNLWNILLSRLGFSDPVSRPPIVECSKGMAEPDVTVELPPFQTLSDWIGQLAGTSLIDQVNNQMIKWCAAYSDEGLATWTMPSREQGFYHTWRELAQGDYSGRFLGVPHFQQQVRDLPATPEEAIVFSLEQLGIPKEHWTEYLSCHFGQLPGWASFFRWRSDHPEYHAQLVHPIDPLQYLAVRIFYEKALVQVECHDRWGIDGSLQHLKDYWSQHQGEYCQLMGQGSHAVDAHTQAVCRDAWRLFHVAQLLELSPLDVQEASPDQLKTLLKWLEDFPQGQHGPVWLEAYEEGFRKEILGKLASHRGTRPSDETRPHAQLVFCIDVRSESFRRHIEDQGPYETLGFAGFFGIPISHQAFDSEERSALCPVLLWPKNAVTEIPRSGEQQALEEYSSKTRWHQVGNHLFHDLKHNPIGSMMLIDMLGFFFSLGLIGKTLIPRSFQAIKGIAQRWFTYPVGTRISITHTPDAPPVMSQFAQGFTIDEQATFIENGLRAMGLTKNHGRLVVLCGHGSTTENNPYIAAYDCGACGGQPGDPNARVFAAMANNPEIRQRVKENGLTIPEDTWFLPGKHNTTTDRVTFYDLEELPETHTKDVEQLRQDLELAGAHQALERSHRIPRAPHHLSPQQAHQHVEFRSVDWANPRPEWGLSSNAAFLIGRRTLTKGLDLEGRVFLHSYDPIADPEGAILEKIMTAPLIVGEWINMGYYFPSVDPWVYGSGSKVLHNVVAGIGVMLGSQSDLQIGFPIQSVYDGAFHYHEPMRLLGIIEAPRNVIASIIQKHEILQQLFNNQWMNLLALDPNSFEFHRYHPDETWEPMRVESP